MDIEVKVNCTPQELRTFFGLPDVEPVQREMMERAAQMMREGASAMDPMSLMKPFLAPNTQVLDAMQRAFMQGFTGAATPASSARGKEKKKE